MDILIAGATGKTGLRLVEQLQTQGHSPIALVRESSDTSSLGSEVTLRHGDLTDLQSGVCDGCDAVIFAAGSGGSTGPEMTDKVDRDGAKRLIDLAAEAGISRFVMLSSVGAEDPDPESELGHYLQAKHDADEHLKASGLSYAIIRPVSLTDEDGNRDMRFGDEVDPKAKAARGDVAAVLANAVQDDEWTGKALLMQSVLADD
ncbi:MAG: SDR family oxidoreductase [Sphingomonadales bacterium]|nr:SDR family oxidoreductase [Sphingomonadales bacterium]PIX67037.1 MAG: oxidoreductase [Sphingomonadales bacterium CG_4_10_14_3_um_filter_58_15]NCO49673.1 SDR family oxidoreductase [Sphingomonadales bacterium]NCP00526.1 SDR family oxidoreductase [Sphingomonadales bacterium]NCP26088.1 SDR family oxidoreductase [Sphingomonadales bacterium]